MDPPLSYQVSAWNSDRLLPKDNPPTADEAARVAGKSVTRQLRFKADRHSFPNGSAVLRCTSSVSALIKKLESKIEIRLAAASSGANLRMAQISAGSTSSCLRGSTSALLQGILTLLVALLRTSTATS